VPVNSGGQNRQGRPEVRSDRSTSGTQVLERVRDDARESHDGFRQPRGCFLARLAARVTVGGTFHRPGLTHHNPFGGRRTFNGRTHLVRAGSNRCHRLPWRPALPSLAGGWRLALSGWVLLRNPPPGCEGSANRLVMISPRPRRAAWSQRWLPRCGYTCDRQGMSTTTSLDDPDLGCRHVHPNSQCRRSDRTDH
jgi:hypothetical protein